MTMHKAKAYGDPAVAARLMDARRAAGFKSARAAAAAYGWSIHTYQAHESAARDLKPPDIERYASALGVSSVWISEGVGAAPRSPALVSAANRSPFKELDDPERMALAAALTEMQFSAGRLAVARMLAGFKSASAACRYYGWTRSTYGGHEGGRLPIPASWCDVYGAAYGVLPGWIRNGTDPAGLPDTVAAAVRREERAAPWVRHPDGAVSRSWDAASLGDLLAMHALPSRRGGTAEVKAMHRRREAEKSARSMALSASEIELVTGIPLESGSRRDDLWGFPREFLRRRLGVVTASTLAVPATRDEPNGIARAGDVFVIDTSDTTLRDGYYVVAAEGGGHLADESGRQRDNARPSPGTPATGEAGRGRTLGRLVGLITKVD